MNHLQTNIALWLIECFGQETAADKEERAFRFIEESLELVQASGVTKAQVLEMVDYTYSRPKGAVFQEVGGVVLTLACFCHTHGLDMFGAGSTELSRVSTPDEMAKIRHKQATKPHGSPLPGTEIPKCFKCGDQMILATNGMPRCFPCEQAARDNEMEDT